MRRAHLAHLATRFFGSLWPFRPSLSARRRARQVLLPAEWAVWTSLGAADMRHSLAVADAVAVAGGDADAQAAALLHDIGKLDCDLGVLMRVAVTVAAEVLGYAQVASWAGHGGLRGRGANYVLHDRLGAELLAEVGARPLATAWAGQHHGAPYGDPLPEGLAAMLARADGD